MTLQPGLFEALMRAARPARRKVFVSYHHAVDQGYYDAFSVTYDAAFEVIRDNSLARGVDSDDPDYVMRRIRENHISGSSCTVVLCGAETPWRKYVDWEIKATLEKRHGLVAIRLPTAGLDCEGNWYCPDRILDNLRSCYAVVDSWENLYIGGTASLNALVEAANGRSKFLIDNGRPVMARNGAPPWRR